MRTTFIYTLLVLCAITARAQHTFILVRHAEKVTDGTNDPALTAKGEHRAVLLADMLANQPVDSVLSTPYKRTLATVKPLANQQHKTIGEYAPAKQALMLEGLLMQEGRKTFVIAGHSNTVPDMVNYLLKEQEVEELADSEYDKIFLVYRGKETAGMVLLRYPEVQ